MKKILKGKTIVILIVILIIIIFIINDFQNKDKEQGTDDFEDLDQLEFTINLVENPYYIINESSYNITNKCIYYQFKNIKEKTFTITGPEMGKSLDFIIKAKNGTEYHHTGPITLGPSWWKTLSTGEIKNGTQVLGYKMIYSNNSVYNYTHWQNSETGEYWFFQPGIYKIYGRYESKPTNNIENILVGIWYSNTVTLIIE